MEKYATKFELNGDLFLTLAGGDVNGLLLSSSCTKSVISRNSTGNVAIRLQLMSSETNFKPVTSKQEMRARSKRRTKAKWKKMNLMLWLPLIICHFLFYNEVGTAY